MFIRRLCAILLSAAILFPLGTSAYSHMDHPDSQPITYNNTEAGTLHITNQAAPGTQIPKELFFKMQVTLDGHLLPIGTVYNVGEEQRSVETAGELLLRTGETAAIAYEIPCGTTYKVTELSAALDGYRPTYSGIADPFGALQCTQDGVTGIMAKSGAVHITISNADYDFAVQIPIQMKLMQFQKNSGFAVVVEQVQPAGKGWKLADKPFRQIIQFPDCQSNEMAVTIGYDAGTEGIFTYRISARPKYGALHDLGTFLVEVRVFDEHAEITNIDFNEERVEQVVFSSFLYRVAAKIDSFADRLS